MPRLAVTLLVGAMLSYQQAGTAQQASPPDLVNRLNAAESGIGDLERRYGGLDWSKRNADAFAALGREVDALRTELDALGRAIEASDGNSDFVDAVLKGDIDRVRRHLAEGADVNQPYAGSGGSPVPLFWVPALLPDVANMPEIVEMMLATGRVDARQPQGRDTSLVYLSLADKRYETAQRLIAAGFDFRHNVREDRPMLVGFAATGDVEAVRVLLDAGLPPDQAMKGGTTGLMQAAARGHLDAVRLLVERGADVRRGNDNGVTALAAAKQNRHADVVAYLESLLGTGPVDTAIRHDYPAFIGIEADGGSSGEGAGAYRLYGNWQLPVSVDLAVSPAGIVEPLHRPGPDDIHQVPNWQDIPVTTIPVDWQPRSEGAATVTVRVRDAAGNTATASHVMTVGESWSAVRGQLVEASRALDTGAIRTILARNGRFFPDMFGSCAQSFDGCTTGTLGGFIVLHVANTDDTGLLAELAGRNVELDYRSADGRLTPLTSAIANGRRAAALALIDAGANPDIALAGGARPVHLAARLGDAALADRLAQAGADLNAPGPGQLTALHFAAIHDHEIGRA
ncbi:MAG: ankyrin repeat domain-containing protein, partial [Alphaproteobacteria bacterium]